MSTLLAWASLLFIFFIVPLGGLTLINYYWFPLVPQENAVILCLLLTPLNLSWMAWGYCAGIQYCKQ